MAFLQTTVKQYHDAEGQAGSLAKSSRVEASAYTWKGASGLNPGTVVLRGAQDNECVVGGTSYLGIVLRHRVIDSPVPYPTDPDTFDTNETVSVARRGDIWVNAPVNINDGDPVTFAAATGIISNVGGTTIVGATWLKTVAANGRSIVRLP